VVEIENDREFDVGKILRQLKKDDVHKKYPTKIIIPKEFEGDTYRFQNSGIYVWYWTAECKWICKKCRQITTTTSSLTPDKCDHCEKSRQLSWKDAENIMFEEAKNNPTNTYALYSQIDVSYGKPPY
jgi:hypothetical protein